MIFDVRKKIESGEDFTMTVTKLYADLEELSEDENGLTPMADELLNNIEYLILNTTSEVKMNQYLIEIIKVIMDNGMISNLSFQVLTNAEQKIESEEITGDLVIQYISNWMKKIAEKQELLPDEKLIVQIFNSNIYLTKIDINKIAIQITGPSNN
ncbi:hypothetical protein ESZ50_08750 [Weissella muntiaci]|uniref:Uncharacterized protein n=1 Tax=Weissella muntiaci TaxID=2508881 RepID=A0A6C2C386_9LACO|nr:hypothetical protein [Weissella muntiaci]TYC48440.1 hypothetical protein ESZ50_08750 [Weissella muntiaci]